jgi:hypothetical protein
MATRISRPVMRRCGLCGRVRLSRSQYAYRRVHGLPVWRCQHWRRARKQNRDLAEALGVVVLLMAYIVARFL